MNLIESIYAEPLKWSQSEYTFDHQCGARIWTCNGFAFYAPYPGGSFSLRQKFQFARARRWWTKNAPVECFGRGS